MPKVQSGQPFAPSAAEYNRLLDLLSTETPFVVDPLGQRPQPFEWVKNNTGSDQSRAAVLGIDGVLFSPTDNSRQFEAGRVVLDGAVPVIATHTGKFVVLLEPIKSGKIGRAARSCAVPVKLEVDKTWHEFADVKASTTELKSKPGGGARILYQESGTGTGKWAYVEFCTIPMVVASFDADTAFTTTDGTETGNIGWSNIPGYATQNITVENQDASADHIFAGDAADIGLVYYDVLNDKWRLHQMECP